MRPPHKLLYAPIAAVPVAIQSVVSKEETDGNGHMNVRHIYAHGVHGADLHSEMAGINDNYRAGGSMGTFAAEHHISYFAEIHEGASIASRPLWIARSQRAAHLLVLITNESAQELSAVLELIIVNMDLATRKPTPFPEHVADAIDSGVKITESYEFEVPVSGSVGTR